MQFQQLGQTQVKNGGSALYDTKDSPAQVIAYYLGAMPTYGWTKVNANSNQASFRSDKASLSISANTDNGITHIIMILADV